GEREPLVLGAAREAYRGGGDGAAAARAHVVLAGAQRAELERATAHGLRRGVRGAVGLFALAAAVKLDERLRDARGLVAHLAAQKRQRAGVGRVHSARRR